MEKAAHAYCDSCGKKIKREMAKSSEEWTTDDKGWLCPVCNPETNTSW